MDNYFTKHPYHILVSGIITLLIAFGILAGLRYHKMPREKLQKAHPEQVLNRIASDFTANQQNLIQQSNNLADQLQEQLIHRSSLDQLYETLKMHPQFWGAVLYQGKQSMVWNGFSLLAPVSFKWQKEGPTQIKMVQDNNVIYWLVKIDFTMEKDQKNIIFHLFTAKRIWQQNVLAIGANKNYSMLPDTYAGDLFNTTISIGKPLPDQYVGYRVLKSLSGDSVGVVVATAKNIQQVTDHWKRTNHFWRSIFIVLCILIFAAFLYVWLERKNAWKALLFQIVLLGVVWFTLYRINIAQSWLSVLLNGMPAEMLSSYQALCVFFINAFLLLCFAYTLKRKIRYFRFRFDDNSFISMLLTAICVGLLNAVIVSLTFKSCYQFVNHSQIPLLTLQIFPGIGTLLFYLCIGVLFLALTIIIRGLNRFLLYTCGDLSRSVSIICCITFLIGAFVLSVYGLGSPYIGWAFIVSLIYFGVVFLLSVISFRRLFSPLRTTAIYSSVIALAGVVLIYQPTTHRLDGSLDKVIQEYTSNSDKQAEKLTQTLLNKIHSYYQSTPDSSVEDRLSYLQAQVPSIVNAEIRRYNKYYFYDIQLRNVRDSILLNFSNNLNTPQWMQQFSNQRLHIVNQIQNITAKSNRSVVQQPKLEDANKYQSFYRGWMALYGKKGVKPVAWVLCSIYRNYPNFSKPLRAVINQQYYQYEQHSYLIQVYRDGQLRQKKYLGFPGRYPVYTVLTKAELQAANKNHSVYYTSSDDHDSYRNLLKKLPNDRVIKASVLLPGYQNILFLYFQLSIILFVIGFILTIAVRWFENGYFSLFGTDDRFQYRILDSILLATIFFLIVLVCITWLGARHQNKELVKQQLFKKLTSLTTTVGKELAVSGDSKVSDNISVDLLASKLNVDALLYQKRLMVESTTPQIYRQNLLPKVMPFPVYQDLYLNRVRETYSIVKLNDQKMILGYRSVESGSEKPTTSVAIPTFIKSPLYNQQILQTTSYLIILYIIVFGIFIIGTVLITRRLTKPLDYVQRGLREISRGELDTTIPVTSRDEIGNLAGAYNEMVERLRELRKELAATERENAWQEMAQQVAHEIKNPLTPMKLNVQYLQRQLASGEYSVKELTQRIKEVTGNLTEQINSLSNIASDFSKFSEPLKRENFRKVDVNNQIQSVANLYKHDSSLEIKIVGKAQKSEVLGVEDELHRVLVNLVKNAKEAIEGKGMIKLKTYNKNDSIFIEVDDNGQGIAEKDKSRIFVPNFSTKSSGTGLGLAICRKVIEAHEGSISFASILGKGTTFVIKLPLLDRQ